MRGGDAGVPIVVGEPNSPQAKAFRWVARVAAGQISVARALRSVGDLDGALAAIREEAERGWYRVEGLAPTSRAAQLLEDAGMPA